MGYLEKDSTKYKQTHIKETTFNAHVPKPLVIHNSLNQKWCLCFKGAKGPTSHLEKLASCLFSLIHLNVPHL